MVMIFPLVGSFFTVRAEKGTDQAGEVELFDLLLPEWAIASEIGKG